MRGLILKPFTDKNTLQYYEKGQNIEFADMRAKELSQKGFIEIAEEIKPETKKTAKRAKK